MNTKRLSVLRWLVLASTIAILLISVLWIQQNNEPTLEDEMNALLALEPQPPLNEQELEQWFIELALTETFFQLPRQEPCLGQTMECLRKRTVAHLQACIGMGGCTKEQDAIEDMINRYLRRNEG